MNNNYPHGYIEQTNLSENDRRIYMGDVLANIVNTNYLPHTKPFLVKANTHHRWTIVLVSNRKFYPLKEQGKVKQFDNLASVREFIEELDTANFHRNTKDLFN